MPKTDFTCRDKILGGYYADADTQCQMFHICVKIAGVVVSKVCKYRLVVMHHLDNPVFLQYINLQ